MRRNSEKVAFCSHHKILNRNIAIFTHRKLKKKTENLSSNSTFNMRKALNNLIFNPFCNFTSSIQVKNFSRDAIYVFLYHVIYFYDLLTSVNIIYFSFLEFNYKHIRSFLYPFRLIQKG